MPAAGRLSKWQGSAGPYASPRANAPLRSTSAICHGPRACRKSCTATSVPPAPPPTIATSTGPMRAKGSHAATGV